MRKIILLLVSLLYGSSVFTQDTNMLLLSEEYFIKEYEKLENSILIHGKAGKTLKLIIKAALKSKGNITVIRAKNINDAANKIESFPGKINRIFFLCHGDAKDGHKAFFSVGSTFLHSKDVMSSSALDRIATKLASTPGPLQSKAQVTVFACGAGGTHNGGIELLATLAKKLHATVFGPQGFGIASSSMFTDHPATIQQRKVTDHDPEAFSKALQNHGNWTRVYEYGYFYKAESIANVYFDSQSRIHYTTIENIK